jgi:curli biogenesis system outer membrane secretion channel CsgG
MNRRKRFIIIAILLLVAGASVTAFLWKSAYAPYSLPVPTDQDILALSKKSKTTLAQDYRLAFAKSANVARADPSRRIRLAVGWLGLPDENQNRQAGDLIVADLSAAGNLELIERQSLNAVLKEEGMSLSGLVRAQTAVRVGKLLQADWFLLGNSASINGHNYLLARIVDARTGALRDLTALPDDNGPLLLAASVADFVRQSRNRASAGGRRTLLAIGSFPDFSPNAHQAGFGGQLRAHLLASFQGSTNVIMLERECVDLLLQEVRLDLAGMTDHSDTNSTGQMLAAMWMVDGNYQSYEVKGREVELGLTFAQAFGRESTTTLRGAPDEAFFAQAAKAVQQAIADDGKPLPAPTYLSEMDYQMERGDLLSRELTRNLPGAYDLGLPAWYFSGTRQSLEGAIRSYQTVLLLDPDDHRAKVSLALCLMYVETSRQQNLEEARNYLREVGESSVHDKYTPAALAYLGWSYRNQDDNEAEKWFRKAVDSLPDSMATRRLLSEAEDIADERASRNRSNPTKAELAEDQFRHSIRRLSEDALQGSWNSVDDIFDGFVAAYNTNSAVGAQRLAELLPELT